MNIKTIERMARRQGLTIRTEYDPEFQETVYTIERDGKPIGQANDNRLLYRYLQSRKEG